MADGLIGRGRQKAAEEGASGRSSAAAQNVEPPRLSLGVASEQQVLVNADGVSAKQ